MKATCNSLSSQLGLFGIQEGSLNGSSKGYCSGGGPIWGIFRVSMILNDWDVTVHSLAARRLLVSREARLERCDKSVNFVARSRSQHTK
jgi:hypothetical protein